MIFHQGFLLVVGSLTHRIRQGLTAHLEKLKSLTASEYS